MRSGPIRLVAAVLVAGLVVGLSATSGSAAAPSGGQVGGAQPGADLSVAVAKTAAGESELEPLEPEFTGRQLSGLSSVVREGPPTDPFVTASGLDVFYAGTDFHSGSQVSQIYRMSLRPGESGSDLITWWPAAGGAGTKPRVGNADSRLPVASADRSLVAFASAASNLSLPGGRTGTGIYLDEYDGAQYVLRELPATAATAGLGPVTALALSADGSRIAIAADPASGGTASALVLDTADGHTLARVGLASGHRLVALAADADASLIAFADSDGAASTVRVIDVATGDERGRQDCAADCALSLSADGSTLAFTTPTARTGIGVWTLAAPATQVRRVASPLAGAALGLPRLTADGTQVVFTAATADARGAFIASPVDAPARPVTVDASGDSAGTWTGLAVNADASVIAVSSPAGSTDAPYGLDHGSHVYLLTRDSTLTDTRPPAFPRAGTLTAKAGPDDTVELNWPNASDDYQTTGYTLTMDGKHLADLDTVDAGAAPSYVVAGVPPGTVHAFTVIARDAAGNQSAPLRGNIVPTGQLDASVGDDGAVALTWAPPPAGLTGTLRVERADGTGPGGAFAGLAELPLTADGYTDSTTLAGQSYRYRVVLVEPDGTSTPLAGPAQAVVAALRIGIPTVTVDDGGWSGAIGGLYPTKHVAVLGSRLQFAVEATPGQQVMAVISTPGGAPLASDITLTEDSSHPGSYSGSYPVDGTITPIQRITAEVTDGKTTKVSNSANPNATVSGALELAIADIADPLTGLHLALRGSGTETHAGPPIASAGTVVATIPAGRWLVTLMTEDEDTVADLGVFTVEPGQTVATAVTPERHATLAVALNQPGDAPYGHYTVTVSDSSGTQLATRTGIGGAEHTTAEFAGLPKHQALTITATLTDAAVPRHTDLSGTAELAGGAEKLTLDARPLDRAAVHLTVGYAGKPYVGTLTISQDLDGRSWPVAKTDTDTDGTTQVQIYAGQTRIRVEGANAAGSAQTIRVDPGAETSLHFDLIPLPGYHIRPHLFTQNLGAAPVEQPRDWRTNYHLHPQLGVVGGRGLPLADEVVITAAAGDQVELCADGREGGLSSGCATVTLGEQQVVDVNLYLTEAGGIAATLHTENGATYSGAWRANVYRVDSAGTLASVGYSNGTDGDVRLSVPAAGDYLVNVTTGSAGSARVSVHVPEGERADAGALTLHTERPVDGAAATVTPDPALPGALLRVRVDLPASAIKAGDVLEVSVPSQTTFEPESVTVGGEPVTATVTADTVTIALPVDTTAVRYAVTVAADATPGRLESLVRLRRADGTIAPVATAIGRVAGVTLSGPDAVITPQVGVTGTAPAGATVTFYVNDVAAGTATAGAGGRFTATVDYEYAEAAPTRGIIAVAEVDGLTLRSDPLEVRYDPHAVVPISATIENGATSNVSVSRAIRFDPARGPVSFTQVYVPGAPTQVTVSFSDNSRVSNFRAIVGRQSAAGICNATGCTAVVPTTVNSIGDIFIDYDVDAAPVASADDLPRPSIEVLRHALRAPYNATTGSLNGAGTMSLKIPGVFDGAVTAALSTRRYTPTTADLDAQRRSGVPIYDVVMDLTPGSDTGHLRFGVPLDWLGSHAPQLVPPIPPAPFMRSAMLTASPGQVLVVLDVVFKAKGGTDLLNSFWDTFTGSGPYVKLNELERLAREKLYCNPALLNEALTDVERAKVYIGGDKAWGDAFSALGLLLAPEEVADEAMQMLGDVSIGAAVDRFIAQEIAQGLRDVTHEVMSKVETNPCQLDQFDEEKYQQARKIAEPRYIIDPSGYTYQGVVADRVEGVTATIYTAPSADPAGPWTKWDAAAYGQTSPQLTDTDGRYGWDVNQGWYKIVYEKAGYQSVESDIFHILPERTDLNANMLATAAPVVTDAGVDGPGIVVTFDKWMDVASVRAYVQVAGDGGQPIAGAVSAVDGQPAPDGTPLAKTFRFVPATAWGGAAQVHVRIAAAAVDYAGVALGTDAQRALTVDGTDGGTTDGGATDGETTDSGKTDNGATDGESALSDVQPAAGAPADERAPDGVRPGGSDQATELANTGVAASLLIQWALLLVVVGAVCSLGGRRHRRSS